MKRPGPPDGEGALFEFRRHGRSVKVTAVDPRSLIEVSIVGDAALGEPALARLALRKLAVAVARRRITPSRSGGA